MKKQYIYTYVQQTEEIDLCQLEQRAFFNTCSSNNLLISDIAVDPTRSPFMRERVDVIASAQTLEQLAEDVSALSFDNRTFKVINLNDIPFGSTDKMAQPLRRKAERKIGLVIKAEPELDTPDREFGLIYFEDIWYFGPLNRSISVWRHHMHKPQSYSTALSTRVARAIANIAAPKIEGVRIIDPCCGIGTVIVEALSMSMNIVGRDISPFVCMGSRKNIAHFGYDTVITKGAIEEVTDHYDVAIIDLPYNVFTAASREQQLEIIKHANRIADKVVIVTIESMDDIIKDLNMRIIDRGIAKKQSFKREILVCQ